MRPLFLICLLCALPVQAKTLIEQAYEAGILDIETALIYQVQAVRDPDGLPAEFRELPVQPVCGTPLILQALEARDQLSAAYGRRLGKLLARPGTEHEQVTAEGHFRIHYDLKGSKAVDPQDDDGNGVPDYVDVVARTLEEVWSLQVGELDFDRPPGDGGLGGGSEYDVYITELGRGGAYGFTYPETGGHTSYSYLELDNNYTDAIYRQTKGLEALQVTVAHEFNHAIQFGYYQGSDGIWWQEATSTWMEEVAYPEVDDYLQYLPSFLLSPEKSLDSGNRFSSDFHIYGASIFAHFLGQKYDPILIRNIWEEFGRRTNARIENFDRVLDLEIKGGLEEAVSEFAIWNYFTGHRHREGYYHEGDKYPATKLRDIHVDPSAPKVAVEFSDQVDHLASTYLHLEPQLLTGGVTIDFSALRGQWNPQLILVSREEIEIRPVNGLPIILPSWNQYQDVVLVLTVEDQTGVAFEYSASIEYDPDLIGGPLPTALHLGQNYPNPFRPDLHGQTIFPFALDAGSAATRLSIFAVDGRLVWRSDLLENLPPRTYVQPWNGTNQRGEIVGSGIYYGVLETDGRRIARTLAVTRGDE